jgi:threonyl-tRNA synthetase
LSPLQAVVLNITDRQADYVREVAKALTDKGFRVESDLRNEKIGFKIREHTLQRVPYLLVIGDREVEGRSVAVRDRKGKDLGTRTVDDFIAKLSEEVANRAH